MTSRLRAGILLFGSLVIALAAGTTISILVIRANLLGDIDNEIDVSLETTAVFLSDFDLDLFEGLEPTARGEALTVVGPDGSVLTNLPAGPPDAPLGAPDLNSSNALERVGQHYTVEGLDDGPNYRVGSIEVGDDGTVAVIARPLDSLRETLATLTRTLVISSVGVLLVLAGAIWIILRASLRPVEEMISTAQTIADGDYSRRADVTDTNDDMQRLGGAINTMLDQVQTSFERQQASEGRLKRFVSDASHELRTPLTTVKGYSELYLSGAATDDVSVTKQMTRINSEATRMGVLVDDLLTLARLDQGRGLDHDPVDLRGLLDDVVADARVVDTERTIDYRPVTSTLSVLGDEDRLRQVFSNILANTRHHTPPGTAVEVRADRDGTTVTVSVADNGPGMAPETADAVFDRFFRAEESRTRSKGGSGLGLAIVATIVDAHGGSVHVETTPGAGTTFVVTLPISPT